MAYTQSDGTRQWNKNAQSWRQYYGENDPNRRDLLDPLILDLLGDVSAKRILDAGCGDGYFSRKLRARGAIVTGVEAAAEMLALATGEESKAQPAISYHLGSVSSMDFLANGIFDTVITNNVIQDVEKISGCVQRVQPGFTPGRRVHPRREPPPASLYREQVG